MPIIQGPFGGGLSSVDLVVAVGEAGGLGSFGVHHLTGAQIKDTAAAIRTRTSRPFALNLWIPFQDSEDPVISAEAYAQNAERLAPFYQELGIAPPPRPERYMPRYQEQVEALLEARPAAFSFVYGVPAPDILDRCKELDIVTIGTATTPDEARLLDEAGVDMIVATGFEAGGHRVSFLRAAEDSLTGTLALVPQVVDAVKAPVIAAGGIADGRGIAAALALGAQAVQIGTAFLACRESATSELHRDMLFSPEAKYTTLTRVFSGRLARFIRNRFVDEMRVHEAELPGYPVHSWFTGPIKNAATVQNRPELLSLYGGQSASLLRHRDARSLVASLVDETGRAIGSAW
ncbi:NAD(P)H-dependent flavin oxidoreductase [Crenobacter cavernae]|uniref:Propionate 3-nitronate monooxygenase n=1 Tax=Crenobacter cavernae TaxID=2290923 RepID=A0ABY0FCE1_9NEIS|nr:nitronate monooxygenase [Crenobacter cavernae]RXZ43678.1 nitronate monooxygenase [Crenobacter cavernae]